MSQTYTFQAEIQQLLHILVHSLYTDREIFLRELISNASDALNRAQFELLTNHEALNPDLELRIDIKTDEAAGTLTISDTGIGMTSEELVSNLGVIARSGAKAFIDALKDKPDAAHNVIGQFGVGFYSVFMVADKVRVVSRSYRPDALAYAWESGGGNEYTIEPADRDTRGTDIIITLKEDAKEFTRGWTLKEIIRRHSDYISFPIYVDGEEQPTNKQTAIWRQMPNEVNDEQYNDFYKMFTLDFEAPLHRVHMRAEAPLQFYALLYFPAKAERNMFSTRTEPGLKLYARKVLIQEYTTALLPDYLQFVQGVVDSEDLPLSVSRETVQANRIIVNLKKTLTNKVLSELKRLAKKKTPEYLTLFDQFGRLIKQGLALAPDDRTDIEQLLLFPSLRTPLGEWISLDEYVEGMAENQDDIYYLIADDPQSARRSPHLDVFRKRGIDVLLLTDPIDPIVAMNLSEYKGHKLHSADEADLDLSAVGQTPEETMPQEPLPEDGFALVKARFEQVLGERVKGVRESKSLTDSPARLVSEDAGAQRQMFRINRILDRDYELPIKTLELNPRHPLIFNLSGMIAADPSNKIIDAVAAQVFEVALLQEGLHPDPAGMADSLYMLMEAATGTPQHTLPYADIAPAYAPRADATGEMPVVDLGAAEDQPENEDAIKSKRPTRKFSTGELNQRAQAAAAEDVDEE